MPELSTLTLEGSTFYYRLYNPRGSHLPLICLHGYTDDSRQFAPLAKLLPDYPLYCPDFPMIHDDLPATLTSLVQFIETFTNLLNFPKFNLLGFSLGGMVAVRLTPALIPHLNHLYLLDTAPTIRLNLVRSTYYRLMRPFIHFTFMTKLIATIHTHPTFRRSLGLPHFSSPGAPNNLTHHHKALYETLTSLLSEPASKIYYHPPIPTTIIHTRDDTTIPLKTCLEDLRQTQAQVIILNQGGHATLPSYWPQIATIIKQN